MNITAAWTTNGNIKGLLMSLSSVLLGTKMPYSVIIRCDGEFPSFSDFYLEQLSDLCRIKDVPFAFYVERACGVHLARESLLDNSPSDWVFMLDDDVILEHDAMEQMSKTATHYRDTFSFICGGKRDVNNRRGYKDFSLEPVEFDYTKECSPHLIYQRTIDTLVCKLTAADSGCMLVNRKLVREKRISFAPKDVSFNVGGEDSLFGLQCAKKGIPGYFCPNVVSWHLEKPFPNFGSHDARCEIVLRTAESMGIADGKTELKATMPWCKPNRK